MVAFTAEQIEIIKTTWLIPKENIVDSGEAILLRFFEKYPDNQAKFHAFKNLPLSSLKGNKAFRAHGQNVMRIFDEAVACFDKENPMEEIETIWTAIAATHSKRKISEKSFLELKDVILEIMTAVCNLNQEQQEAWMLLFDAVYGIVFPLLVKQ